ncbi:MAG TPA: hypothetical protein VMS64_06300 [Candidatus Methylomirabilis sp.]|nr:hypothetical protein [Candidatus Methylomirabilis sp.]
MAAFAEAAMLAERQGARLWQAEAHVERGLTLIDAEGAGSVAGRAALERARLLFHQSGAQPREQRMLTLLAALGPSSTS